MTVSVQLPTALAVTLNAPLETAVVVTIPVQPLTVNVAPPIVSVTVTTCVCAVPLKLSADGEAPTVPGGTVGVGEGDGLGIGEALAAGVGDELAAGVGDAVTTGLGLGCGG